MINLHFMMIDHYWKESNQGYIDSASQMWFQITRLTATPLYIALLSEIFIIILCLYDFQE